MKSILLLTVLMVFSKDSLINRNLADHAEIAIIVNAKNPLEKLSLTEVRIYWLRKGKKRWQAFDSGIYPVDRKEKCIEKESFYSRVLGLSVDEVDLYFTAKQYQSAEKPPDKFKSDAEIIRYVSENPGAIGYVNNTSITSEYQAQVKTVSIYNI